MMMTSNYLMKISSRARRMDICIRRNWLKSLVRGLVQSFD
ncbi:hypothetical protein Gohar_003106 [Gossypium harknessii]|uniref:Uncharacterized protein n=1 Tax=Gossypium harknessii TaxID=34285 RepID=A0A7J9HMV7_9ROSI|nr:hypothetical protein [Gossypium harknessii]